MISSKECICTCTDFPNFKLLLSKGFVIKTTVLRRFLGDITSGSTDVRNSHSREEGRLHS